MSLNYQAERFTCSWPWSTAILLCDGRISCGCSDPYAKRVLGDTRLVSLAEVWRGPTATELREDINTGGSGFCGDCPLKLPLAAGEAAPVRDLNVGPLPNRLYVECTAACNISCFQACCAPETGITRTRQAGMLDFDLFTRVIDEAGPSLVRVDFFNYGEAFLHKRAVEMCEYIKTKFPHIYLYTSTNGLALNEEKARRLVHSGIDEVTFSIDGASQDTYVRYRQRGKFDLAIANLRAMADEKAKARPRRAAAQLALHPLQLERLGRGDGEGATAGRRARRRSAVLGDHRSPRGLVLAPLRPRHRRLRPHQVRGLGSQRARQRHPRRDAAGRHRRAALPADVPLAGRPGETVTVHTRVRNLSTARSASWPATAGGWCGWAPSWSGPTAHSSSATTPGPGCLATSRPAAAPMSPIDVPLPETPGRYALKFDLVSEGIDWFETCGSPTTTRAGRRRLSPTAAHACRNDVIGRESPTGARTEAVPPSRVGRAIDRR